MKTGTQHRSCSVRNAAGLAALVSLLALLVVGAPARASTDRATVTTFTHSGVTNAAEIPTNRRKKHPKKPPARPRSTPKVNVADSAIPIGAGDAPSSSVDTILSNTTCYPDSHRMDLAGEIVLNQGRFPNGAWVANRYFYYAVDGSGNQTSQSVATRWRGPQFLNTWRADSDFYGSWYMSVFKPLYGETIQGTGRMHAVLQVAVWNGASYEYTTVYPESYDNYYWTGLWGQTLSMFDCLLSRS